MYYKLKKKQLLFTLHTLLLHFCNLGIMSSIIQHWEQEQVITGCPWHWTPHTFKSLYRPMQSTMRMRAFFTAESQVTATKALEQTIEIRSMTTGNAYVGPQSGWSREDADSSQILVDCKIIEILPQNLLIWLKNKENIRTQVAFNEVFAWLIHVWLA